jgi:carbonic anhydrase/acetyltransferase-like protein (isoleucine patch superfamily)
MIRLSQSAVIVGDVRIADRASVWHGAVLRGDFDYVEVGADSNIQDNTVLHVDRGMPCRIGSRVTVGHSAVVHGCAVEDDCLVGMNATVNSGAVIRHGSLVASGALVPELATYPERSLIVGVPAKAVRAVDDVLRARIELSWKIYRELADRTLPARPALSPDPSKQVHLDLSSEFTRLIERR